ncbi:hypothetical protein P6144_10715 [Sphingomonas sp. HITSZ_GF]|uniref:alpha/beta hydrolase family protein n=1 Tax=Sphingomonas sp. HITSZ_GF TaxID=3037247 RepID=UPI00240E80DB|nr:hypothetical protein [Sphingomonas sp. HITSZ_GF]MDG2534121.1 hypothetical protein [Sphingomonas sp. HITSZ_GF]
MLIPDLVLIVAVLALAAWRLCAPSWRPRLRIAAIGFAFLLAAGQWAVCGFTWQDLPAYLLLALSALPPIHTGAPLRWIGRLSLVALAAVCVGVWILPAVPTLPQPDGRYAVGTRIYRWTDASRDEPHTADPADRRSVIAQAWYPVEHGAPSGGARLAYIDGIGRLPDSVSGVPSFLMRRYGQIDTHATPLAPLARSDRAWPVVLFSPGYGAPRAAYTGLATQLASRGFVVFVLDHPYEAAVTELPNGQVVGTRELLLPGERDHLGYMAREQVRRTADMRFVIDQLARPGALPPRLRSRIDTTRVAVIGHSFGGAAAIAAASADPRIVAAANIDGTPYGDLPDRKRTRPLLLIQSDYAETHHSAFFLNGNAKLLADPAAPGFRFEIGRANHYSFTDAPFFFAPPGRWLLAQAMGGERGPGETQRVTADILAAFLAGPLTGVPGDPAAAASRYPGVTGGAVKKGLPAAKPS